MTGQLFRQEVVEQQGNSFWADFTGLNPVKMAVLTTLLLVLVLVTGWFLANGEYRRKAVVAGIIVSEKGTVKVRAPASGVVEEVLFGQGDWVGKGDSLLEIRSGKVSIEGGNIADQLITENTKQLLLLQSLITEKIKNFPVRIEQLESELKSLQEKQLQAFALLRNRETVNNLMRAKVERLNGLVGRNHISKSDLESAHMEALQQESAVYQSRMELETSKRLIEQTLHEKQRYKLEFNQQQAELKSQASELRKQNLQLGGEKISYVVSPVSGTIAVVYPSQGQSVIEQQPLLTVLQGDSLLEAELYVPSRSAGFLEPGLPLRLSFDAFPYQKFGTLKGRVMEISKAVLLPDEVQGNKAVNEPYYRVSASLEESFITAYGKEIQLRPGMQLKANIILENRSLIEWILEPLFLHRELH